MTTPTDLENQPRLFLDRVIRTAWILVFLGAAVELVIFRSMSGGLSLTAAGTVAIINFRWLEVVVHRVVQPGRPSYTVSSILQIIGRFALLGVMLAALVWVPNIDPVAVALGFTALVVALIIEGVRGGRVGGG
ncbi:MAG: ATP synthase subunit I [Holophagae bacterium]|jgi:hypothetical protein